MSLFQNVLQQIHTQLQKKGLRNNHIAEIISTSIGVLITPEQVSIRNNVVTIAAPSTIKLSIQLKQKQIINSLKEVGIIIQSIH